MPQHTAYTQHTTHNFHYITSKCIWLIEHHKIHSNAKSIQSMIVIIVLICLLCLQCVDLLTRASHFLPVIAVFCGLGAQWFLAFNFTTHDYNCNGNLCMWFSLPLSLSLSFIFLSCVILVEHAGFIEVISLVFSLRFLRYYTLKTKKVTEKKQNAFVSMMTRHRLE